MFSTPQPNGISVEEFRSTGGSPICVAFVGINHAEEYTSYEGERPWPTDGKKYKHPFQEAASAERRLREKALPSFDEFLFLRFKAANVAPYAFEWVDHEHTTKEYAALLLRISRLYDERFAA